MNIGGMLLLHDGELAAVCYAACAGVCDPVKDMGSETRYISSRLTILFFAGPRPCRAAGRGRERRLWRWTVGRGR